MFEQHAHRFYPVIDKDLCDAHGIDPDAVAQACFAAGARMLQIRVKSGSSALLLALADAIVAAASQRTVIVNDRADIARIAGAGGVHVGQDDLPPDAVRSVFGQALVGLSTHEERQVDEALASAADYIAVGPIFATGTKDTGYTARGLSLIRYAAGKGKPVVAIGGIDLDRAPRAIDAGASAVAVVSDLLRGDPRRRADAYIRALA